MTSVDGTMKRAVIVTNKTTILLQRRKLYKTRKEYNYENLYE